MKAFIIGSASAAAGLIAWFSWGPLLHWLWSFAPSTVSWYPIYKVACVVLVGYCGGIALPLFLIVGSVFAALHD